MPPKLPLPRGWNRRSRSVAIGGGSFHQENYNPTPDSTVLDRVKNRWIGTGYRSSVSDAPARQGKRGDRPPGVT